MRRRNGWQLPPHKFQVAIIIIFFLLVTAFYCFFAPFLGEHILQSVAWVIYTALAITLVILYIRCTSIDPADPGIISKNDKSGSSAHKGSLIRCSKKCSCDFYSYRGGICFPFTKEDCKNGDCTEQQVDQESGLICTICDVPVLGFSKHCRKCNKCVDAFDHHCVWINNCVGKKNYKSFIALISASVIWLFMEFGLGFTVLVLCFTNKTATKKRMHEKLGNHFSIIYLATIVGVCSVISLLVLLPLGELLCFHILLIKKEMTTYEYVVAMRAKNESPETSEDEREEDVFYTPLTGLTVGRSHGVHHKGIFCTPQFDHDDQPDIDIQILEPITMAPSSSNPESDEQTERAKKLISQSKTGTGTGTVRISSQNLAKLDKNEVTRAVAKAKETSSTLRPYFPRPSGEMTNSPSSFTTASSTFSPDATTPDQPSNTKASPMMMLRGWASRLSSLNPSAIFGKRNKSTTSTAGMPSRNNEVGNNKG